MLTSVSVIVVPYLSPTIAQSVIEDAEKRDDVGEDQLAILKAGAWAVSLPPSAVTFSKASSIPIISLYPIKVLCALEGDEQSRPGILGSFQGAPIAVIFCLRRANLSVL